MDSPTSVFVGLVLSLMISSFVIGAVYEDKEHVVNGKYINPFPDLPQNNELNFTSNTSESGTGFYEYVLQTPLNSWDYVSGLGYVSNQKSTLILLSELPDSNGEYTNIYYINNTLENPFQIIVKKEVTFANNIYIRFDQNEIRIPNNLVDYFSDISYNYPELLTNHYLRIETNYNFTLNQLSLSLNNVTLWDHISVNLGSYLWGKSSNIYLGGIYTEDSGLIVSFVEANQNPPATSDATNTLFSIWNTALMVIAYNIPGMEWWVNFLFIKTQVLGIVISALAMIRG